MICLLPETINIGIDNRTRVISQIGVLIRLPEQKHGSDRTFGIGEDVACDDSSKRSGFCEDTERIGAPLHNRPLIGDERDIQSETPLAGFQVWQQRRVWVRTGHATIP